MKYKFIQKDTCKYSSSVPDSKTVVEVDTDTLDDLLTYFEYFLRGCSFVPKGTLQFVEEGFTEEDLEDVNMENEDELL